MRVIALITTLIAATMAAAYEAPKELQVTTTFLPEQCDVKAKTGDQIRVHYTGTLHNGGNKFDSSHDRGDPLPLTLGVGQVIKGWDEGLQGMCVGEKRTIVIPSNMAYGSRGFGSVIPGNSALVFDVELMALQPASRDELDSSANGRAPIHLIAILISALFLYLGVSTMSL